MPSDLATRVGSASSPVSGTEAGTAQAEHLGGFVAGGDPATFYPDLWEWLVQRHNVRSVLDVGCGDGQALNHFRSLGCDVVGVEGVPQNDPDIIEWDYTTGPYRLEREFDLCWSCEFVEHVSELYVPNFLASFKAAHLVLLTHAEPGQQGYHHVNCQPSSYWEGALAAIGYVVDEGLTEQARRLAAMNTDSYNHFIRSGLAFCRSQASQG